MVGPQQAISNFQSQTLHPIHKSSVTGGGGSGSSGRGCGDVGGDGGGGGGGGGTMVADAGVLLFMCWSSVDAGMLCSDVGGVGSGRDSDVSR